ncbi:MAG TPA: phosphatase PAP2 family protein, partial [Symbiobacteriaceae bacterium]|nr:phosphatase PAP2 family protein [Symbiobacteriaceae bacterium]
MWQYFAGLDTAVSAWVALHRTPVATAFMRAMTLLGSSGGMALLGLLAAGFFVWQKRRRQALTVIASLAGSWLANELLKALFHRERPGGLWLTTATGYSFPSGHAMVSSSFLLVMALLLSAGQPAWRRWLLSAGAVAVSGL